VFKKRGCPINQAVKILRQAAKKMIASYVFLLVFTPWRESKITFWAHLP
jgi:hypothetical protein